MPPRKRLDELDDGPQGKAGAGPSWRADSRGRRLCYFGLCPDIATMGHTYPRQNSGDSGPWYCIDHYKAIVEQGDYPGARDIEQGKLTGDVPTVAEQVRAMPRASAMVRALVDNPPKNHIGALIVASRDLNRMDREEREDFMAMLKPMIRQIGKGA